MSDAVRIGRAAPVAFGGCFGWFHPAAGRRGVVLCSPHGYEALCAHRSWRELAERLADAGLPTLRFDYPGAGDSPGDDEQPDRVRAWIDGIRAAAEWLREHAGVEELALVGLRLGGTLAAEAAQGIPGVHSLALLAAPITGKAYARELRALAMLAPPLEGAPPPGPEHAGDLEAAGFVLTTDTLEGLKGLDLLGLKQAPAPRVLLLNRPDAPADARLPARLRGLGVEVQEEAFAGFGELMRDAHFARSPEADFAALADWLGEGAAPAEEAPAPPPAPRIPGEGWRETPVAFGDGVPLFGVLCEPATPGAARPALLFLNTGSNHHVGASRMSVTLARRLAAQGFTSLRFDVAGIGDTPPRPGQPPNRLYSRESHDDVRAALDWLEGRGHPRAVAIGLCSGAYLAFHTAVDEPRIVGQVLINAQRLTWEEGDSLEVALRSSYKSTRFYVRAVLRAETWRRLLRGRVNVWGTAGALLRRSLVRLRGRVRDARGRLLGAEDRSEVVRGFHVLCGRGVRSLLVYGAQDAGIDELESHVGTRAHKLRGRQGVEIRVVEGMDHTLTSRWAREVFARLLEEFLAEAFPPDPAAEAASPRR